MATLGLVPLGLAVADAANAAEPPADLGTYHGNKNRNGLYVVPGLTGSVAAATHPDTSFSAPIMGNAYAQPVFWRDPDSNQGFIVEATESNYVYGLSSVTGAVIWRTFLGTSVAQSALPCGDINPLGVTGTPAIQSVTGTVYVDGMVARPQGPRHLVFALSAKTGAVLPGWPINVTKTLADIGIAFDSTVQNQRSALTIVGGKLYVPYGGLAGDCGSYHGTVVGVDPSAVKPFGAWSTIAALGGIWAQGGIAYDGQSMFVATGNTRQATQWGGGEAVIRLNPDLTYSTATQDYFTPKGWMTLDDDDLDLGGTGPLPIDLPAAGGAQPVILALGKNGHAYLMDRTNLGGIGDPLLNAPVASSTLITAPASYQVGNAIDVAYRGTCSGSQSGLGVFSLTSGSPPTLQPTWCAPLNGAGSPIVTTSNGIADPIVWVLGAAGDNSLHAFDGVSGKPLYSSAALTGLHRYQTVLVADGRLYAAADNRIYAFSFGGS